MNGLPFSRTGLLPGCCATIQGRMCLVSNWACYSEHLSYKSSIQGSHIPVYNPALVTMDTCIVFSPREAELALLFLTKTVTEVDLHEVGLPISDVLSSAMFGHLTVLESAATVEPEREIDEESPCFPFKIPVFDFRCDNVDCSSVIDLCAQDTQHESLPVITDVEPDESVTMKLEVEPNARPTTPDLRVPSNNLVTPGSAYAAPSSISIAGASQDVVPGFLPGRSPLHVQGNIDTCTDKSPVRSSVKSPVLEDDTIQAESPESPPTAGGKKWSEMNDAESQAIYNKFIE